jgi:hypothetical protein
MPRVEVTGKVEQTREEHACKVAVEIRNGSKAVALATRLKLVDPASGLLVAPVLYSDNYFSLLPGESKRVTLAFPVKSAAGNQVSLQVEGWNVTAAELAKIPVK